MSKAITNTSPLLYLHSVEGLDWLPRIFSEIWTSTAVLEELKEGERLGYDVPNPADRQWLKIVNPRLVPSEWLSSDLGKGELAALSVGIENPGRIIILDDALARRIAKAAGLEVWGTLRIILEAKQRGLTSSVAPLIDKMIEAGMWLSPDIQKRILRLAGEEVEK